jgi:nucleoside-diphosphate-sugar epimerase
VNLDLVTGATGFIGGHLAERLLREGRTVRVLCRPGSERRLHAGIAGRVQVVAGDLRDETSLRASVAGVERVFHCAGHVSDWGAPDTFEAANVRGTEILYREALAAGVLRAVHFSSIAVFGTPSPPSFDDETPLATASTDGYTATKVQGEDVTRAAFAAGLPVTILRPAVVYGARGTWLEEPLAMIEQGKMFLLGGGRGTCHPCYIENLLDATLLAATHPRAPGQAYIVGDGERITFREYFDAVARVAGRPPVRRSIPLPLARTMATAFGAAQRFRARPDETRPLLTQAAIHMVTTVSEMSDRKIREELGFEPRYTFARAIDELRARYRERGSLR